MQNQSQTADALSCQTLLYLALCEIEDLPPSAEIVRQADLFSLYQTADRHMLSAMAASALLRIDFAGGAEESLRAEFLDALGRSVRRQLLSAKAREDIFSRMDAEGIFYMPLKGCVLEGLYPGLGLRQMSDNDIYFNGGRAKDLRRIMESLGYHTKHFGGGGPDVYQKEPFYHFEMHKSLFMPSADPSVYAYYRDLSRLLRQKSDGSRELAFLREEDFYLYQCAHAYKHFSHSGTGIRTLLDEVVYIKAKGKALDWDYVASEAKKIGISSFEKLLREMAADLLSCETDLSLLHWSGEKEEAWRLLCRSGTFGTRQTYVSNELKRLQPDTSVPTLRTKIKYWRNRAFLPKEKIEAIVPRIYRSKVLIPFYIVYRALRSLMFDRGKIKAEWKIVKDAKGGSDGKQK